jgi:protein-tyrosine phosphatase
MMRFADIHTHLIPGVDDGATSIEQTVEMLRLAYDNGTRSVVATPHMFLDIYRGNTLMAINDRFATMMELLGEMGRLPEGVFLREMDVTLGAEHYGSVEFVQALEQGLVLPINGSVYLLVEFSPFLPWNMVEIIVKRAFEAGYFPIIAHVERIVAVQEKPAHVKGLVERGCLLQVNAESFLDDVDGRTRKTAQTLAHDRLLHVIASDGHRPECRPPLLLEASRRLLRKYRPEQVEAWMWGNPRAIVSNLRIDHAR